MHSLFFDRGDNGVTASQFNCLSVVSTCKTIDQVDCLFHLHVRPWCPCFPGWLSGRWGRVGLCGRCISVSLLPNAPNLWRLFSHPKLYVCSLYLNKLLIIPGDAALCHIDSPARCFATDNPEPEPENEPELRDDSLKLCITVSKTKELIMDFRNHRGPDSPIS